MMLEDKEIFGIPLILYMVLAVNISIKKSSSVVDVYDQIFSIDGGKIYERSYDAEHRINQSEIKKHIYTISQKIAFWIFENSFPPSTPFSINITKTFYLFFIPCLQSNIITPYIPQIIYIIFPTGYNQ